MNNVQCVINFFNFSDLKKLIIFIIQKNNDN